MRWMIALGLVVALSGPGSVPALASGPLGGIGQGFESGLGWGICTAFGKGAKKLYSAIKNKGHKNQTDAQTDERNMTAEDYYNRGLEDGYARAREESSYYEGRYARNVNAGANYDQQRNETQPRYEKAVYARKVSDSGSSTCVARSAQGRVYSRRLSQRRKYGKPAIAAANSQQSKGGRRQIATTTSNSSKNGKSQTKLAASTDD